MGDEKDMEAKKTVKRDVDRDTARRMKAAGLPRPPDVTAKSFNQVEELKHPKYETIAYLVAKGTSVKEISEVMKMSQASLKTLIDSERMKFQIRHLQFKLFGKDAKKRFNEILPTAVDAIEAVLADRNTKPAIRLQAAIYATDRAMGKPKQSVEVEGSLIRELFDRLDGKKTLDVPLSENEMRDVTQLARNPNEHTETDLDSNPNFQADPIDDWASKNLK